MGKGEHKEWKCRNGVGDWGIMDGVGESKNGGGGNNGRNEGN